MTEKHSLSFAVNGHVNAAEFFWRSSGRGDPVYISTLWVAPLIFGRSLYDPTLKRLIKATGLSRKHGTLLESEFNGMSEGGHIWRLSKRTHSEALYLTFTFCPSLPHSWLEVTRIILSRI